MVDDFVLLQLPQAGDDRQAIKKGIVEIADLVVFNKADIDERAAAFARGQMKAALTMLRSASPNWRPPVLTVSALAKRGIVEFWAEIERYRTTMTASGEFEEKRRRQAVDWMWNPVSYTHLDVYKRQLPDLGLVADRPGPVKQCRAHCDRGDGCGFWRHPVPAHQCPR